VREKIWLKKNATGKLVDLSAEVDDSTPFENYKIGEKAFHNFCYTNSFMSIPCHTNANAGSKADIHLTLSKISTKHCSAYSVEMKD
jgi:hypothetical protein